MIGVLAAQLINLMIAEPVEPGATQQMIVDSWNGQMGWRWMFGAELVPALAFLVLMFCPRVAALARRPVNRSAPGLRWNALVLPTMPTGSCVKSRIPGKG